MRQLRHRLNRLALAVAAAISLWGTASWARPAPEAGVGLPRDISAHGHLIDAGLHFGNVAVVLLFAMVFGWLVIAYIRFDQKHPAKYDHGNSKRAAIAVAGFTLVIFLLVDGHHFTTSVVEFNEVFGNKEMLTNEEALRVEVNARQWAWQFRYAGPDGKFGTEDDAVTLNDLRVPVDRPVVVQMRASDVVHSLYIPNLRVKTDAMPGMTNWLWFQVDRTRLAEAGVGNEFPIGCAQHCGTHHYKMGATLTVYDDPADFEAWLAEAVINSKLDYEGTPDDPKVAKWAQNWGWEWLVTL